MQNTNITMSPAMQGRPVTLVNKNIRTWRAVGRGVIYAALVAMSVLYVLPFWWMLITSVKTVEETFWFPPTFFPQTFTLEGYLRAWNYLPWARFLLNTLTIVFGSVIGSVLSCTLCAYGFARLRFPGRDIVFIIVSGSMMLPYTVTLIPTYIFFHRIGWVNTLKPLIIPAWFGGGAFNIFLMRQFFTSVPADLVDAAYIDGCSRLGIWWKIMLPLSKPALTAVTVFTIQGRWNDFFGPLIFLHSREKMTLALGLQLFAQTASVSSSSAAQYRDVGLFTALMAGATVVTLPMIILFVSAQKYFVEGIQLTGIKG